MIAAYKLLRLLLIFCEVTHIYFHLKVLLGIGGQYSKPEYLQKRMYFVYDAFTPLMAYFIFIPVQKYYTLIVACHLFLHLFYIIQWTNKDSFFVNSIIDWSVERRQSERLTRNGYLMYAYNTIGTIFDIVTHVVIVQSLLKNK